MAKTRAQRKAERRAREARGQQQGDGAKQEQAERAEESQAQHDTQVPVSGEVAEIEAVEQTGARLDELESQTPVESPAAEELEAPAPSRADAPPPAKPSRRQRAEEKRLLKTQEREEARRQKAEEKEKARDKTPAKRDKAQVEERRRGGVTGFIASCWAELKRVQWPDRETLIQASAVTLVFVAVAAAYLGALDAIFSWLVKRAL